MADHTIVITPEAYTSPDASSIEFVFPVNINREFPIGRDEIDVEIYERAGMYPPPIDNESLELVFQTTPSWTPQSGDPSFTDVGLLMKFEDPDDVFLDDSQYANSPYEFDGEILHTEQTLYGFALVDGFYIASGQNAVFNNANNWTVELSVLPSHDSDIYIWFNDTATGSKKGFNIQLLSKQIYTNDYDAINDIFDSQLIGDIDIQAYRKYDFAFVNDSDILSIYVNGSLLTTYGLTTSVTDEFQFAHYTTAFLGAAFDELRFTAEARYSGASYTPQIPFSTVAGSLGPTGGGSTTTEDAESTSSASVLIVGDSSWETEGFIQTSSGIVGVKVFGTVRDDLNNLASRTVRLHNRSTGALISEGASDPVTGAFVLNAIENEYMYLVVFDNLAGPKNAKIYDKIFIAS